MLKKIGDITVRSNLVDYNFRVSDSLLMNQSILLKSLDISKNNFYTSSRGVDECNIVVSKTIINIEGVTYLKLFSSLDFGIK